MGSGPPARGALVLRADPRPLNAYTISSAERYRCAGTSLNRWPSEEGSIVRNGSRGTERAEQRDSLSHFLDGDDFYSCRDYSAVDE